MNPDDWPPSKVQVVFSRRSKSASTAEVLLEPGCEWNERVTLTCALFRGKKDNYQAKKASLTLRSRPARAGKAAWKPFASTEIDLRDFVPEFADIAAERTTPCIEPLEFLDKSRSSFGDMSLAVTVKATCLNLKGSNKADDSFSDSDASSDADPEDLADMMPSSPASRHQSRISEVDETRASFMEQEAAALAAGNRSGVRNSDAASFTQFHTGAHRADGGHIEVPAPLHGDLATRPPPPSSPPPVSSKPCCCRFGL